MIYNFTSERVGAQQSEPFRFLHLKFYFSQISGENFKGMNTPEKMKL